MTEKQQALITSILPMWPFSRAEISYLMERYEMMSQRPLDSEQMLLPMLEAARQLLGGIGAYVWLCEEGWRERSAKRRHEPR